MLWTFPAASNFSGLYASANAVEPSNPSALAYHILPDHPAFHLRQTPICDAVIDFLRLGVSDLNLRREWLSALLMHSACRWSRPVSSQTTYSLPLPTSSNSIASRPTGLQGPKRLLF
jgi:hypothetical protein